MSSFADEMERRNSTQSIQSRGDSEIGSHYQLESGLFVTSFTATIFIATLVTVGVLFITLLTSLTVMLQSCQNRNDGLLQLQETCDEYSYCRIFSLHVEINRLEVDEFPSICKAYAIQYIKQGQYIRDLKWTLLVIKSYFNSLKPQADGLDVVLMDIDHVLPSNHPNHTNPSQYGFVLYKGSNQIEEAKLQEAILIQEMHSELRASAWSLIFITRKPENFRNATIKILNSAGYGSWSSLIMRSDDEMLLESWEYFSKRRVELQTSGFRIASVISSQMDALTGPCLGKRIFKLPNPLNYKIEHHEESM